MVLLGAAVAVLVAVQADLVGNGNAASYRPWGVPPPAGATVDIGVTTLPLARNSWRPWQPSDLESVNAVEHAIRKHVSVVMWYADWAHNEPSLEQLRAVAERGSVPEVTWEPWDAVKPTHVQPRYRLRNIIEGQFDDYIRAWAQMFATYGGLVRLRFAHEMNGNWYPWSEHQNGNRFGEFVRAWRHVHDIFQTVGATNVEWVWSPAAISIPTALYPGGGYVDMVSLSVFNGGLQLRYSRWRPLASLIERSLARLRRIAPGKPIELSEIGCAEQGGNKPEWISAMFATLRRNPEITSVIWYDLVKGSNWRIESSRESAAAYAAGVAGTRYR